MLYALVAAGKLTFGACASAEQVKKAAEAVEEEIHK